MGIATLYPLVSSVMPKCPVILEAGAHIGRDTKKFYRYWPQATLHAFEPVDSLFKQLQENTQELPNIFYYQMALGAASGNQPFFTSSGRSTATSSLLKPYADAHPTTSFTPVDVVTITLDDWAKKYEVPAVDFLWLDMQGGELDALQSGTKLLSTARALYIELSLEARYEHAPGYDEVDTWLKSMHFVQCYWNQSKPAFGNALYINEGLK